MRSITRVLLVLFTLLLLLVTPKGASAQVLDVSWTGAYGPGSADFNAIPLGGGAFQLTSLVSGSQNGTPLTQLDPLNSYGGNDNKVVSMPPLLPDLSGIAFSDGTYDYNIYDFSGTLLECRSDETKCDANGSGVDLTGLSIVQTPEPSTKLLFLSGLGALLIVAARRRRTPAAG